MQDRDIPDDEKKMYGALFYAAGVCAKALDLPCPDLAITYDPIPREVGRSVSWLAALMLMPEDLCDADYPIIYVSLYKSCADYVFGAIAHEMRHFWQKTYHLDKYKDNVAIGWEASVNDEAEIDADGFGIYMLCKHAGKTVDEAGEIVCPDEKSYTPAAYEKRIEVAKKLLAKEIPKKEKKSFGKKVIGFFRID